MYQDYSKLKGDLFKAMTTKPTPNGSAPLSDKRAIDFLNRTFRAFPDYVNAVIDTVELQNSTIRYHVETEEWQDIVMSKDRARRLAHEIAIQSIQKIKRLCSHYGIECPIDVDDSDRYKVADFCCEYVSGVFYSSAGTGNGESYNMESLYESYKSNGRRYYDDVGIEGNN